MHHWCLRRSVIRSAVERSARPLNVKPGKTTRLAVAVMLPALVAAACSDNSTIRVEDHRME